MRKNRQRARLRRTEALSHEDLWLLEALVRFQSGASRSPDIQTYLGQLGERLERVGASGVGPRNSSRSGR